MCNIPQRNFFGIAAGDCGSNWTLLDWYLNSLTPIGLSCAPNGNVSFDQERHPILKPVWVVISFVEFQYCRCLLNFCLLGKMDWKMHLLAWVKIVSCKSWLGWLHTHDHPICCLALNFLGNPWYTKATVFLIFPRVQKIYTWCGSFSRETMQCWSQSHVLIELLLSLNGQHAYVGNYTP